MFKAASKINKVIIIGSQGSGKTTIINSINVKGKLSSKRKRFLVTEKLHDYT